MVQGGSNSDGQFMVTLGESYMVWPASGINCSICGHFYANYMTVMGLIFE